MSTKSPRELGDQIRRARIERRLSQGGLAKEVGVAERTIGRIERGEGDSRNLPRILKYLRIPEEGHSNPREPTLSEATFSELLIEISRRYSDLAREKEREPVVWVSPAEVAVAQLLVSLADDDHPVDESTRAIANARPAPPS